MFRRRWPPTRPTRTPRRHDKQNARIEHDEALAHVMTSVLKDDMELFKQFSDNESFRRCLADPVFAETYDAESPRPKAGASVE